MKNIYWILPVIGAGLVAGCAGPLDTRWENPVYRSLQQRYSEQDRQITESAAAEQISAVNKLKSLEEIRVEDAIRIAIRNHPKLRAAGYRVDAASGRVVQSGLYPNPSLNLSGESVGASAGNGGETSFVIEQEVVLGGKLKRAQDVANSDRLSEQVAFEALEFALAMDVSRAYYRVQVAHERFEWNQELVALSSRLLDSVQARVEAGSATETDQLRAEVVYEQAQLGLDASRLQVETTKQSLASAVGVDAGFDMPMSTSIDQFPELPTYEMLVSSTLEANSRMSLARIAIERAMQAHKLAQAESKPGLFASIGPRYSDIDHETTVDLGLSLVIPLFDRNQGEIDATLFERLTASAELRNVQLELLAEVSAAWGSYQSALKASNRYRDQLLPKAERTLDLTRQAYQSGKVDFLRLLDAQQVIIESRLAYLDTLEQLHSSAALLNQLSQHDAHWRDTQSDRLINADVQQ